MTSHPDWHEAPADGALPYRLTSTRTLATHTRFHADFIHTDQPLDFFVRQLRTGGARKGVTFCLSGKPGTGKSEFVRYLAAQMDMPLIDVHAGDILYGKIGATERIIEQVFTKAAALRAGLLLDEADTFLYARTRTRYNWEAQLVNEFIRNLDRHTMPVFCTTNRLTHPDPAILRRMMFKIEFLPLRDDQRAAVFRHYFNLPMPDYMATVPGLTLGDFGLVHRKAEVLDCLTKADALCHLFYQEVSMRNRAMAEPDAPNITAQAA